MPVCVVVCCKLVSVVVGCCIGPRVYCNASLCSSVCCKLLVVAVVAAVIDVAAVVVVVAQPCLTLEISPALY